MSKYTFLPELILRTPAKPFQSQLTELEIINLLKDKGFQETIFLASPSLYQAILDYNEGKLSEKSQKGVLSSAAKYIIRSHTRSTPFGLFAGTATLKWGEKTSISINQNYKRKTQLDFGVINDLYKKIKNNGQQLREVRLYPNSTFYIFQEEIRYIEKAVDGNEVSLQISALEKNDFILFVLNKAESGLTISELSGILEKEGIEKTEAHEFLISLIDSQILVDKLEPILNSTDKLESLISLHRNLGTEEDTVNELKKISSDLNQIDIEQESNIEKYLEFEDSINRKTFHTECFFELDEARASLNQNLQKNILEALTVLNTLKTRTEDNRLNHFKTKFERRFGSSEVPLLVALDTEKGLGYDKEFDIVIAPLIKELDWTPVKNLDETVKTESYLESLLKKALSQNCHEIKLEEENLPELNYDLNLSASSSILFKTISKNQILLEAVGGSSAINLICRFANSNPDLGHLVEKIAAKEVSNNPSVVFAEIIHLPNTKLGNVLSRKSVFEHEISFLGVGKGEKQIALRDLVVFLQEDTLFLKDLRSNQIIIPKLNCTHNVGETDLPVYKFLYDLQFQGLDGSLKFDWDGKINNNIFFPRVSYKGVIISLATWEFRKTALADVHKLKSINDFEKWHQKLNIPPLFVISEGDNDLLIDTKSEFLIQLFIDTVKNKKQLTLKEFLLNESQPVKNSYGESMANQFIATLLKSGEAYKLPGKEALKSVDTNQVLIKTENAPYSNWLYIKVYCPLASVDSILSNEIANALKEAFDKNLIDKWFFIRYRDPDFHLRVRFHLNDIEQYQELIKLLNHYISNQTDIWKVELGSYEPEYKRFAAIGIEAAESIFHFESSSYLNFLACTEADSREDIRWLYALKYIDDLMSFFEYSLSEKLNFISFVRNGFAEEFGLNQEKKKLIDKLYRENKQKINETLSQKSYIKPEVTLDLHCKKEDSFNKSTLAGLTHMCINRIMNTQPRLHEFVIYDFLLRSYKSILAQQKN
ncbi:lantibiotic dehydratase [Arcticibacterium luteifluviistationis]|uniref:Lantibiotic dehydratase n=1 Tax=Arcticibacterium luteifluviistationis TaxID=1784714 RepID=A0A2Z4GDX8_9BACT|nr:lantibiotic dehydratase [Arcticibacterium luteifluviistationis]AWV99519.1 hypothetical protein DJ013_15640 [Arcticibacterium luteifluviistationis]